MSKLFHVNEATGKVSKCRAKTTDGCPFGSANHFSDEKRALLHVEETLASREAYLEAVRSGPREVSNEFTDWKKTQILSAVQAITEMRRDSSLVKELFVSKRIKVAMARNDPQKVLELLQEYREAQGDTGRLNVYRSHDFSLSEDVRQARKAEHILQTMLFQRGEAPAPAPLPLPVNNPRMRYGNKDLRRFSKAALYWYRFPETGEAAWHNEQERLYIEHGQKKSEHEAAPIAPRKREAPTSQRPLNDEESAYQANLKDRAAYSIR